MSVCGILLHIRTDLGDHVLRRRQINARDRYQSRDCFRERAAGHLDLLAELLDFSLEVTEVIHQAFQHETVMFGHLSVQGQSQQWNLVPQTAAGQVGHLVYVGFPVDQSGDHPPSRDAQNIRSHQSEFDVGVLQLLMDPVGHSRHLVRQLLAHPRQIPKLPLRQCGNEAPSQKPTLQQLGQPLAILHVRLAPGHVLDMARVYQNDLKLPLQDVVDRLPKHPGRFHSQVGNPFCKQPIAQAEQIASHGAKGSNLFVHLSRFVHSPDTYGNGLAMNIGTSTAAIDCFDHGLVLM